MNQNDPSPSFSENTTPAQTPKSTGEVSETDLILHLANPDAAHDAPSKSIDPHWQKQYDGLRAFRDYLIDEISSHSGEARGENPDTFDSEPAEDSASDLTRDYLLAMSSTEQDTLYEVEDALRRIENGTYGICELTGKPIPPERLAAVPWTRYSIEAQQGVEEHNEAPVHASLGQLPDQPAPPEVPANSDAGREVSEPPPPGTEKYSSQDQR